MKTRNTKKTTDIISSHTFEDAMRRYAEAERREMEINKTIATEVDEIMDKYKDELQILAQGKQISFGIVNAYCVNNKETLFSKRRSIGTAAGIAGFRLGTPRLKTKKGNNWDNVLAALKKKLPAYIRVSEEPAKDLLLADRNKEGVAPLLAEIGVQVVQDELFYIETGKAA